MSVDRLCRLFGKTRQGWYKAVLKKESREMQELVVVAEVERIRKLLPGVGTVKLHIIMAEFFRDHQINMGIKALNEVLRKYGLLLPRYKRRTRTTNSRHRYRKYESKIETIYVCRANALWVSDITYIRMGGHFVYLSLITDAYSRKIIGWSLQADLRPQGPLEALKMALSQRANPDKELVHHSDRGIQYCSHKYVDLLNTQPNLQISMTQNSDPAENAIAERVNGIIKNEMLQGKGVLNLRLGRRQIRKAIETYNKLRPHMSCNFITPEEAHQKTGPLRRRWKPSSGQHSHKPMPPGTSPLPS